MNIVINNEEYIDSEEVANKIGVATSTLKVMMRAKEVPTPIKLKTMTFWKKEEIDKYLDSTKKGD